MVSDKEIRIEGDYLVHPAGKVISNLCYYFTTEDKIGLAEKILREEFGLMDDRKKYGSWEAGIERTNLVYERGSGENKGIAHFHLFYQCPEGPHLSFHHWPDRMTPEDFSSDRLSPILERLYHELKPYKITHRMGVPLKEKFPWEE